MTGTATNTDDALVPLEELPSGSRAAPDLPEDASDAPGNDGQASVIVISPNIHTDASLRSTTRPSHPESMSRAPHVSTAANTVENNGGSWFIQDSEGNIVSDRLAQHLRSESFRLYDAYRNIWREEERALRLGCSIFVIEKTLAAGVDHSFKSTSLSPRPLQAYQRNDLSAGVLTKVARFLARKSHVCPIEESVSSALREVHDMLTTPRQPSLQLVLFSRRSPDDMAIKALPSFRRELLLELLSYAKFLGKDHSRSIDFERRHISMRLRVTLPSQKPNNKIMNFAWPRRIPMPSSSQVYIWRTYRNPPEFEEVQLHTELFAEQHVRTLLIFNTEEALQGFSVQYNRLLERDKQQVRNAIIYEIPHAQLDRVKHTLSRIALEKILRTLHEHDLEARDDPSRTRLLYLTQLKDYVVRMEEEIIVLLDGLQKQEIKASGFVTTQMIKNLQDDNFYLLKTIKTALSELKRANDELDKYATFKQTQQNTLVGFLISLYVPMAFITSYFGMNTAEINGSAWPLSSFWATAIPLTLATIVLPVTFGSLLRILSRPIPAVIDRSRLATSFVAVIPPVAYANFFVYRQIGIPILNSLWIVVALLLILRYVLRWTLPDGVLPMFPIILLLFVVITAALSMGLSPLVNDIIATFALELLPIMIPSVLWLSYNVAGFYPGPGTWQSRRQNVADV